MLVDALGLKDYALVWELQRRLVERRRRREIPDTLLLCEHLPVYTRGVSSKAAVPPFLPYPLHTVERGGDLTYHGPGQLVGYPILDLAAHGIGPRAYLRTLETVLASALIPLGLECTALRGFTGLWCRGKKVASLGVAVKDRVSYHGFALNVNCDLAPFRAIYPCNLQPDQMATLQGLLGRPLDAAQLAPQVADAFLRRFSPSAAALSSISS